MVGILMNIEELDELKKKTTLELQNHEMKINEFIDRFDTLEMLSRLSYFSYITIDSEKGYKYIQPANLEHLAGIVLNRKFVIKEEIPNPLEIDELKETLDYFTSWWKISNYLRKIEFDLDEKELSKAIVAANMTSNYGVVRGYSWFNPMQQQIIDLLTRYDEHLEKTIGFTVEDCFEFFKHLIQLYSEKLDRLAEKSVEIANEAMPVLLEKYKEGKIRNKDIKKIVKNYSKNHKKAIYELIPYILFSENLKDELFFSICDIKIDDKKLKKFNKFLEFFSTDIVKEVQTYRFPSDDNIFRAKPILKHEESYLLMFPNSLRWTIQEQIEKVIQKDEKMWNEYGEIKGDYLEKETINVMKSILPEADIYSELYYKHNGERCELDGLVVYDTNLFIIESKSRGFHSSAKKGGLGRLKKNIQENIEYALIQAKRAKDFIESEEKVCFYNRSGKKILELQSDKYKNKFIMNTTLEYFADITTSLTSLKEIGLYKAEEYPWSISLADLKVISDFVEFPTQFIHYAFLRTGMNAETALKSTYELDIFGLYLFQDQPERQDYHVEELDIGKIMKNIILGTQENVYSEVLDYSPIYNRYYYDKSNGLPSEPYRRKFNDKFKKILLELNQLNQYGHTTIGLKLIDLYVDEQNIIIEMYDKIVEMTKRDGKLHDITKPFNYDKLTGSIYGLTIMSGYAKDRAPILKTLEGHCIFKRYQSQAKEWIGLCTFLDDTRKVVNNFVYIDADMFSNSEKDPNLISFLNEINQQTKKAGRTLYKVGRNDLCPCGSGMKYKKCHGSSV